MISLARTFGIKNQFIETPLDNPSSAFLDRMSGWNQTDSGVTVTEEIAMRLTAVRRAVALNSFAIASQPKHLFRRDGNNRVVADDHPSHARIYKSPNGDMTPFEFFELAVMHTLLWGNFYALIHRSGRYDVTSLEVVMPWNVSVKKFKGRRWYRIKGETEWLPAREVLHFRGPSYDGIVGVNPIVHIARQAIGIGLVTEKYAGAFFGEGTHQGGSILLPEGETLGSTDEETDKNVQRLRKSWRGTYGGPDNFFKLLILENGMKFEPMGMELQAAELLATRRFQIAEIGRAFDVPPTLLFDLEKGTYNNVEHLFIEWIITGAMPLAVRFEHVLNKKLLRQEEQMNHFFKINLNGLMRGDHKSRSDFISNALGARSPGWMSPDEAREIEDMNPAGVTDLYVPANMQPAKGKENSNGARGKDDVIIMGRPTLEKIFSKEQTGENGNGTE